MKRKAYFNIKMLHVMFRKIVPNCGYKMWRDKKMYTVNEINENLQNVCM